MGSSPSLLRLSPESAFVNGNVIQSNRFFETYNRIGGGLPPSSSSVDEVIKLRTLINRYYTESICFNGDKISSLHNKLEKGILLSDEEWEEWFEVCPNVACLRGGQKRHFLLHSVLSKAMSHSVSLSRIIFIVEKFPVARNVRVDGYTALDMLRTHHRGHPAFDDLEKLLMPSKSNDRCMHSIFDVVRTTPLCTKTLVRILKAEPWKSLDTDSGLTPLHSLCAFGAPSREGILALHNTNPIAIVDPAFPKSPLQLLCGPSKSQPNMETIKCLIALNPMSLGGFNMYDRHPLTPLDLLQKHHAHNKHFQELIGVLSPSRLLLPAQREHVELQGIPEVKKLHDLIASKCPITKISEYLKQCPRGAEEVDAYGRSPLHIFFASGNNSVDILKILAKNNDDLFLQEDNAGMTPIVLFFKSDTPNAFQILKTLASISPQTCPVFRHYLWAFCRAHPDFHAMDDLLSEHIFSNSERGNEQADRDGWVSSVERQKALQKYAHFTRDTHAVKEFFLSENICGAAACAIQSACRGYRLRTQVLRQQTEEDAATDIQRLFRGSWARYRHAVKVLRGWRLASLVIRVQEEKLRRLKIAARGILRTLDPNNWPAHPITKMLDALCEAEDVVRDQSHLLRDIKVSAYYLERAQVHVLKVLKRLISIQTFANRCESDIDAADALPMEADTGGEAIIPEGRPTTNLEADTDIESIIAPSEYSSIHSVETDWDQGLASFGGDYLQGLGEMEQFFFRSLEFELNTSAWAALDDRDVHALERVDDYISYHDEDAELVDTELVDANEAGSKEDGSCSSEWEDSIEKEENEFLLAFEEDLFAE